MLRGEREVFGNLREAEAALDGAEPVAEPSLIRGAMKGILVEIGDELARGLMGDIPV